MNPNLSLKIGIIEHRLYGLSSQIFQKFANRIPSVHHMINLLYNRRVENSTQKVPKCSCIQHR